MFFILFFILGGSKVDSSQSSKAKKASQEPAPHTVDFQGGDSANPQGSVYVHFCLQLCHTLI